jgi:uncharacterized protein YfaT (DUF1175 family)
LRFKSQKPGPLFVWAFMRFQIECDEMHRQSYTWDAIRIATDECRNAPSYVWMTRTCSAY